MIILMNAIETMEIFIIKYEYNGKMWICVTELVGDVLAIGPINKAA